MFLHDLRYGLRVLAKSPGFTAIAVLTLALGIGLNTALFSVVNAVLLQSLPYPKPSELVKVSETHGTRTGIRVSTPTLRDWRERNRSFAALAGYGGQPGNLAGGSAPLRIQATQVTDGFFDVMAVQPLVGRVFLPSEETERLAVLSHGVWEKSFGGDPKVLGRTIRLDGLELIVVGVMPAGFDFPEKTQIWLSPGVFVDRSTRSAHNNSVVGRLKAGVTVAAAGQDLNALSTAIRRQDRSDRDFGSYVMPLHEALVGRVRPAFLVLLGAVGFVLLMACVNVANLQLAKSGARAREMALRTALGAKQGRLVRQLLTENLLLALMGGGLGLVLAMWGTDLLRSFVPADIPLIGVIRIDRSVLGFTIAASLATGLLFGLLPALAGSRASVNDALKEGSGKNTVSPRARRIAGALVTGEIALAMILLIGASLLLQSFWRLQRVNPGFETSRVLATAISWPAPWSTHSDENDRGRDILLYRRLFARLLTLPGVEGVAATKVLPVADSGANGEFQIEGRTKSGKEIYDSFYRVVTPDYFRVLGIPLLRGRSLSERDDAAAPWIALINESMARQFFPNEDALGKRIRYYGFDSKPQWLTITGIVADSHDFGLNVAARPICFANYLQHPGSLNYSTLLVRASGSSGMSKAIASAVASIDKDVPVTVRNVGDVVSASVARQRFQTQLLLLFAVLALGLAALGIYGVLSYSVERRTSELGIRMALGAKPAQILREVLGEGMVLVAIGLITGVAGALVLTRTLASFLFGVTPTDPVTFAGVACTLAAVAMAASYVPAHRATRVDPAAALRNE